MVTNKQNTMNNKKKQGREVKRWWNYSRNLRWDKYYDDSSPDRFHVIHRQKTTLKLLDSLGLPKGAKILELGYGGGQTAKKLLDRGYEVHGIDISDQLCEVAKKRCKEYVDKNMAFFSVGSIEEKYDYDNQFFDAVIVCGALQYLHNIDDCLKEVFRTLKPNCHFIVAQRNMYAIKDLIGPRRLILSLICAFTGQKTELFASFRSMFLDNDSFGHSLKKYENFFLKYKFLTKGDETHDFNFKKKLISFWRMKKNLADNNFLIVRSSGSTFFFPPKNKLGGLLVSLLDKLLQFTSDHILKFIFVFADNIVIDSKKQANKTIHD